MRLEGGGSGTWIAYALIVAFVALMAIVVLRTVLLFSMLLILPLDRALRRIPGMSAVLDRVHARAGARRDVDVRDR